MITLTLPVSGVPFISETKHEKLMVIKNSNFEGEHGKVNPLSNLGNENKEYFAIEMQNKSLDVPYSDTFVVHERWVFYSSLKSDGKSCNKTYLRISIRIEFIKSTFFKGKINSRAEEGMREYI